MRISSLGAMVFLLTIPGCWEVEARDEERNRKRTESLDRLKSALEAEDSYAVRSIFQDGDVALSDYPSMAGDLLRQDCADPSCSSQIDVLREILDWTQMDVDGVQMDVDGVENVANSGLIYVMSDAFREGGYDGGTLLMLACFYGKLKSVEILLKRGADPKAKDNIGYTAMDCAIAGSWRERVNLASQIGVIKRLSREGVQVRREHLSILLRPHATSSTEEVMKHLIRSGVDVNQMSNDYWKQSALIESAYFGSPMLYTIVEVASQIHYNAQNSRGRTALSFACSKGDEKAASLLIKEGADASIQDNRGRTALMMATEKGHAKIVTLLLGKGAAAVSIDARDADGRTALHKAVLRGRLPIAKLLHEHGASLRTRDSRDRSLLDSLHCSTWNPFSLAGFCNDLTRIRKFDFGVEDWVVAKLRGGRTEL